MEARRRQSGDSDSTLSRTDELLNVAERRLTSAVEELVTGEEWKHALAFLAEFHRYSFANALLIQAQHAERYAEGSVPTANPTLAAGFRRWKKLGRSVCKGQRGYVILAPAPATVRFAQHPDGSAQRLRRGEMPPAGASLETRQMFTGRYTTAYVWDVSQTEGAPIPEQPRPMLLSGQAPAGLWDGLAAFAHDRGFTVHDAPHADAIRGANGLTDFTARRILVRTDIPELARAKTLTHEIGHLLLHDPAGGLGDWVTGSRQHRGRAEVEAESTAFMVLASHGIQSDDYTFPYVATWATGVDQNPVDVIRQTGARVQRATREILNVLAIEQPLGDSDASHDLDRSRQPYELPSNSTHVTTPNRELHTDLA